MQKFVSTICAVLFVAFALGCGGGNTTTTATTKPTLTPINPATTITNQQMGGAIQNPATPLALTAANADVQTWVGSPVTVNGVASAGLQNASLTAARFNQPNGITTNGADFYVADCLNNAIRKIDAAGLVTTLICKDSNGVAISFNQPTDITTDGINLYVVDSDSHTVRFINIITLITETIGSTSGLPGAVDSEVPADVRFNNPIGITTDGVNLYVADYGNHTIRTINIISKAVTTLAGTAGSAGSAEGIKDVARFNGPARITTDGKNLYVTDFNNRTIRKIDFSNGNVTTLAGIAGKNGTEDTAPGVTATFYHPNGITTDGTNLYVTDYNDASEPNPQYWNAVRKIDISTNHVTVTTIAGGISSISPNSIDATGINARLDTPVGITTDGVNLYVADSRNNTIRKIVIK